MLNSSLKINPLVAAIVGALLLASGAVAGGVAASSDLSNAKKSLRSARAELAEERDSTQEWRHQGIAHARFESERILGSELVIATASLMRSTDDAEQALRHYFKLVSAFDRVARQKFNEPVGTKEAREQCNIAFRVAIADSIKRLSAGNASLLDKRILEHYEAARVQGSGEWFGRVYDQLREQNVSHPLTEVAVPDWEVFLLTKGDASR